MSLVISLHVWCHDFSMVAQVDKKNVSRPLPLGLHDIEVGPSEEVFKGGSNADAGPCKGLRLATLRALLILLMKIIRERGTSVLLRFEGDMRVKATLGGNNAADLLGFTDSDWANCPVTRKRIGRFTFTLGSGALSWHARKQKTVTAHAWAHPPFLVFSLHRHCYHLHDEQKACLVVLPASQASSKLN